MNTELVSEAAEALLGAYGGGPPVAPLSTTYPDLTLDEAYAVQLTQVDSWLSEGRTVVGHKVGLTSRAMQELLGVSEPDYGHLLDSMARAESDTITIGAFVQPRIEPEIGFILGQSLLGPGLTEADVMLAVAAVLPALEIVDSRVRDWKIDLFDTIADNASSGAFVLGDARVPLGDLDLQSIECTLRLDDAVVGWGHGSAVMGNPLTALTWLANTLGGRGVKLEAGHVVLPGALCAMVPVTAGDTFTATFAGLGNVSARFV